MTDSTPNPESPPAGSTLADSPPEGSPPLQGESVALTGTLASMTHQQALAVVEENGGTGTTHVSQKTTMLVIGEEGWPLEADGQPSQKLQQVTAWRTEGGECRILNESDWLFLVGLEDRRRKIHGEHTPAMLSQLLGVSANKIRAWERIGLIRAVRTVGRLPFFNFQEVSGARRVAELLKAGVSAGDLKTGLKSLETMLPGVERPMAQLQILVSDSRLLFRDERGLIEPSSRQRRFDFQNESATSSKERASNSADEDSPDTVPFKIDPAANSEQSDPQTPEDWFHEGCRKLDGNLPAEAVECFRMSLMDQPHSAESHFALADALYRLENPAAALERYYAAVECDHGYLDAWMQIGLLHTELGELDAALPAFDVALSIHDDHPDAHFQKANVLAQLDRNTDARPHWQAYLDRESRGPWAEIARQHLAEAIPIGTEMDGRGTAS